MFVISINGKEERCFTVSDGMLSIHDFSDMVLRDKLQLNKALAEASVSTNKGVIRAFYMGMATRVLNVVRLIPAVADDDIQYEFAFRTLFKNLGYIINESLLTPFNVDLFTEECMNIFNIKIKPLLYGAVAKNVKEEVHHYISGITTSYNVTELDELNVNRAIFISGMYSLKLN